MATSYYDPTTRQSVDPASVQQYLSGYGEWNDPIYGYRTSAGNEVKQGEGWTDWLKSQGFRADVGGTGKLNSYMSDLATNYGLTDKDFVKAFQSYGAQNYYDGPTDEYGNIQGFGRDPNVGWWGEDATLRALGSGLDALNPNAAYKGSWQSLWNQGAETTGQNAIADMWEQGRDKTGDFDDLGDILKGVSFVVGGAGLAGAFGGAGAAGADVVGSDWASGLSSAMNPGSAAGGVADAVGNFVPAEAVGGVVEGSGGGNMDWTDFFTNDPGADASSFGDAWNGAMNTGGSDWSTGLDTAMNAGNQGGAASTNWLSQLAKAPTSLLKSLGLSDSDVSMIGKLGAAGLGAYASNQQSNALADVAKQYAEYGAPYRQQLASLQSDPGSFLSSPRVTSAVDQGTSAMARALSARDGNPVGSGRALQEMQNYATNSLYGQLTNRENQLANFGGLSNFNAAAPNANLASVQQTGNMYNAIGAGINDIFNPQPTYIDLLKAMKGLA